MRKSVKVRIIIFDILNEIHHKNKNFDESFLYLTENLQLINQDRSMIYNVVLNSIRNNLFVNEILNSFLQKKTSLKIKILLLCATCAHAGFGSLLLGDLGGSGGTCKKYIFC